MTNYSEIFDMFLTKISDLDLFRNLNNTELESLMIKYLNLACANFDYCKKNLNKKEDSSQLFFISLDMKEIDILSDLMVLEWIKPYVFNRLNLSSFLGDKEFKIFSQANHTKSLLDLKKATEEEIERKKMKYSWNGSFFDYC